MHGDLYDRVRRECFNVVISLEVGSMLIQPGNTELKQLQLMALK